mgnify:CR=1 FL=1
MNDCLFKYHFRLNWKKDVQTVSGVQKLFENNGIQSVYDTIGDEFV